MTTYCVYTIGYEGREIDEFIALLKEFNITRLIDIREIPVSRKRGFSKSHLRARVESENIQYIHLRSLGSPSVIRHKLKDDHDLDSFFKAFSLYLEKNMHTIKEAHQLILDGLNCIMCYERSPGECHRSTVAQKIKEFDGNGLNIIHI